MNEGCSAVFRYVKNDSPWTSVKVTAKGHGRLKIILDDAEAGEAVIENNNYAEFSAPLRAAAGCSELTVSVTEGQDISIGKITLL
jgi:hypothetical protein